MKLTGGQCAGDKQSDIYPETRVGIESALMGFSKSIGPILLSVGIQWCLQSGSFLVGKLYFSREYVWPRLPSKSCPVD